MLLFIKDVMEGANIWAAIFRILGPRPSRPVALTGSSAYLNSGTCSIVRYGTVK